MSNKFMPKSGMVFETADGVFGLFVQIHGALAMLFYEDGKTFNQYRVFKPEYFNPDPNENEIIIKRVFNGMNEMQKGGGYYRLPNPLKLTSEETKLVWEYKPNSVEVKISSGLTAKISAKGVLINGITLPVGGVRIPKRVLDSIVTEMHKLKPEK